MKKVVLFFLLYLFALNISIGQTETLSYAREIIDTLTSHEMNGRGYTDSSDWKAARFIRQEMINAQLKSLADDYFQDFTIDANTFPDSMSMIINGRKLVAGKDYIIDAGSRSCEGKFKSSPLKVKPADTSLSAIQDIVSDLFKGKHNDKFFFISRSDFTKPQYIFWKQAVEQTKAFGSEGILEFTSDKLTWDASQQQLTYCYFQVHESIPAQKKSTIVLKVDAKLKEKYKTQNVIGYLEGSTIPDSFIVFTAHYDHLGQMGEGTWFPGANDNASGISMLLNLARYYSAHDHHYSIVFIAFSGEELGLLGSDYYVQHPLFPLTNIKFLVNLDIVGTGDDGIKVVNATEFPKQFEELVKQNEQHHYLKQVSPRGKAANSDHYPFFMKGVPCFFIYTLGGIAAYHDVYDRSETLPLTDYDDLLKLLIDFTNSIN